MRQQRGTKQRRAKGQNPNGSAAHSSPTRRYCNRHHNLLHTASLTPSSNARSLYFVATAGQQAMAATAAESVAFLPATLTLRSACWREVPEGAHTPQNSDLLCVLGAGNHVSTIQTYKGKVDPRASQARDVALLTHVCNAWIPWVVESAP